MRKTWIDRVLSHLTQLHAGSADLQGLVETVVTARDGFRQQLETFRASWPDNPEVSPQEASQIERSLVDLSDTLAKLHQFLIESNRPLNWSSWIEQIRPPLTQLREQRLRMQTWPTSNETVNRLLRHLEHWRGGGAIGLATRQLLEQLPALEDHWDVVIAQVEPASQEQLWSSLDPALRIFEQWRLKLETIPPPESKGWSEEIIHSLQSFDQLLTGLVEPGLASGPTAFPVINLLLSATDQVLEGSADWTQLQALAQAAAQLFELQVDRDTLAQCRLLESLQAVENLCDQENAEGIPVVVEGLIQRSRQLSQLHRAETRAENLVDVRSSERSEQQQLELPPMLSSLYELAVDYVAGRASTADLHPGITQLQEVVKRFSARPAGQSEVALALEDLNELLAVLLDLETTPSRNLLVELEEVLQDCAQSLATLQV